MEKRDEGADEIKVTDHRRFDSEGHTKPESEATREEADEGPAAEVKEEPKAAPEGRQLPPLDFSTFVLSLATSAQVHMGVIANPGTGKQETNLPVAKETIDLIGMLKDKTKGNLTDQEARLIEHVLYDLRMIYVERNKQGGG